MNVFKLGTILFIILSAVGLSDVVFAKDDVGTVVAVRGKTIIDRDKQVLEAKVKDNIFLKDTVSTGEASRAKMLFIDDSVLTMGEKSRVVIKEFIYSKEKGGKSIFNLLDGKMKSVVGKTSFEVHTPTAVAAARGTVIFFEVGIKDGKACTTILCTDGEVTAGSADPNVKDSLTLTSDTIVTICEGMPFPRTPSRVQSSEKEKLLSDTESKGYEISVPGPMQMETGVDWFNLNLLRSPQINQQPVNRTPVTIDLLFK